MFLDKTEYQTSLDLSLYIEGLLNTETVEVESKKKTEEKIETILLNDLLAPEEELSAKVETKTTEVEVIETLLEEKIFNSSIPAWGQQPFKCLTVKLLDMKLMIPAMSVSYIERINKKIIRLPVEAEAFRGVVTMRERSVAIIDLHKLISGNGVSYYQSDKNVEKCHVEYVIAMEDGDQLGFCQVRAIFQVGGARHHISGECRRMG